MFKNLTAIIYSLKNIYNFYSRKFAENVCVDPFGGQTFSDIVKCGLLLSFMNHFYHYITLKFRFFDRPAHLLHAYNSLLLRLLRHHFATQNHAKLESSNSTVS